MVGLLLSIQKLRYESFNKRHSLCNLMVSWNSAYLAVVVQPIAIRRYQIWSDEI